MGGGGGGGGRQSPPQNIGGIHVHVAPHFSAWSPLLETASSAYRVSYKTITEASATSDDLWL